MKLPRERDLRKGRSLSRVVAQERSSHLSTGHGPHRCLNSHPWSWLGHSVVLGWVYHAELFLHPCLDMVADGMHQLYPAGNYSAAVSGTGFARQV